MPHTKSAKKRLRQNEKRRLANKAKKSEFKTWIKKVLGAVKEQDLEKAKQFFPIAVKKIDKAAKTNVIHKNNAARKKSRLSKAVALLENSMSKKEAGE